MEQVARITEVLCVSVLMMGLLYNMVGFPATEKVVKFVISIYIIFTCFNMVSKDKLDFDFALDVKDYYYEEYQEDFYNILIEETESETERLIGQKLSEKNISYNYISVHILELNENLAVDKIIIQCDDMNISAAEECIKDFITKDTQLIIGE